MSLVSLELGGLSLWMQSELSKKKWLIKALRLTDCQHKAFSMNVRSPRACSLIAPGVFMCIHHIIISYNRSKVRLIENTSHTFFKALNGKIFVCSFFYYYYYFC